MLLNKDEGSDAPVMRLSHALVVPVVLHLCVVHVVVHLAWMGSGFRCDAEYISRGVLLLFEGGQAVDDGTVRA